LENINDVRLIKLSSEIPLIPKEFSENLKNLLT